MMEVQQGRLAGDNPSEEEVFDDTIPPAGEDEQAEASPEAPSAPRVTAEESIVEPADPPSKARKNDPREYVVLEHHSDDDGDFLTEVGRVAARNGVNAIRKAFREHIADTDPHMLVTVPSTQYRLTKVQNTKREVASVQIGT